jgi:hypothetical protein
VNVTITATSTGGDEERQRDCMVATSYLLSNIATRIGNGERKGTLVNRAFGVEASFTVDDSPA